MKSPSGRYVIICNGEIANFKSIKQKLSIKNNILRSNSDIEILSHALEIWGISKLHKEIRGMFQFKHKSKKNGTGGAFWSFHFIHPKTKKIICVSGYVDAPSTTSWTHALREIQAVWKSIQII